MRGPESTNGDRPAGRGSISIVLPAFNEEENIGPMLDRAFEVLPRSGRDFEVIVVDDGSRDATAEVVMGYLDAHYPRIRLLRHEVNRGYGVALRSGQVGEADAVALHHRGGKIGPALALRLVVPGELQLLSAGLVQRCRHGLRGLDDLRRAIDGGALGEQRGGKRGRGRDSEESMERVA